MDANFISLAQKAEEAIKIQLDDIAKKNKALAMRLGRVKAREKASDEKEKQLGEWEKALNKLYEEVSRKQNAIDLEVKSRQDASDIEEKFKETQILAKEAEEKLLEAKAREAEAQKREEAVTKREKEYRKKIETDFASDLIKGFTGKK